jgi:FKBP-type peptidyl-prolyl cis-trans isomerase
MTMMLRLISFILLISTTTVSAFGVVTTHTPYPIAAATTTRADFLQSVWTSSAAAAAAAVVVLGNPSRSNAAASETVTLPNGVVYTILKQGTGPKPERGELVAIRFAAYNGDIQIDNIFDTPEPYYTRLGSGGLIPGVESTLPLMQLGDRWKITIPVRRSFSVCLGGRSFRLR